MTNLDEAQKKTVTGWIKEGLKLSDIQKRLATDLGLNLTYMEVRFLVDDLKLTPKDVDPPKTAELTTTPAKPPAGPRGAAVPGQGAAPLPPGGTGGVSVTVDEIARPGTVASGRVTFTDGQVAEWYLDQSGRLGLMPKTQGYRPPQEEVIAFQSELQNQLARFGL